MTRELFDQVQDHQRRLAALERAVFADVEDQDQDQEREWDAGHVEVRP